MPRSGTTVFTNKLADLTGIAMAPETHFLPEVYSKLAHLDLTQPECARVAIEEFEAGRWFDSLGVTADELETAFLTASERSWATLFATALKLHARKQGKLLYGEKTPGHYRYVTELLSWYSDCAVIFLVRDPRAVVASNQRAPFSPPYSWFIARRWRHAVEVYHSVARDSRVSLVCYEEFVADPDRVLAEIADRLGLGKVDRLGGPPSWAGSARDGGWREDHLLRASKPVNSQSVDRWKRQLSSYDIWLTDQIAGRAAGELGYVPRNAPSVAVRFWILYLRRFPAERLSLALTAAARQLAEGGRTGGKQRILMAIGRLLDQAHWMSCKPLVLETGDNPMVVLRLGSKQRVESSFLPLSAEAEKLGLLVASLVDLGHQVTLCTSSREQFLVAHQVRRAFGLVVGVASSSGACPNGGGRLEVHRGNSGEPIRVIDQLASGAGGLAEALQENFSADGGQGSGDA